MSLADIRRRLSGTIDSLSESTVWNWYARTSKPDVRVPVFSSTAVELKVLPTGTRSDIEGGRDGSTLKKRRFIRFGTYGMATLPSAGDKITDPSSIDWVVVEQVSADIGTAMFELRVSNKQTSGDDRGYHS